MKCTTTHRRAVSLPGDREEDRERERSIGDQLNNIISHIEVNRLSIQHIEVRADHHTIQMNMQIQNC